MEEKERELDVTDTKVVRGIADHCPKCGEFELLAPLHGERGGPISCIQCGIKWHGEHARRRKLGRIVVKAMKAFENAGGSWNDYNTLKLAAAGYKMPGYDGDALGVELGDITSELLRDTLRLTHPDLHPPERGELSHRVTQELIALQPFVFPAPAAKFEPPGKLEEGNGSLKDSDDTLNDLLREMSKYPCQDCSNALRSEYCNPCKAEFEKREQAERDRVNVKQRGWYKRRVALRKVRREFVCRACERMFKPSRKDALHCSNVCRQRNYRRRKVRI